MILAEKLVVLRKQAGLSQEDLADKLDVSRQAVHKWETGQSRPDLDNMKILSMLYSVSIDNLLDDKADIIHKNEDFVQRTTAAPLQTQFTVPQQNPAAPQRITVPYPAPPRPTLGPVTSTGARPNQVEVEKINSAMTEEQQHCLFLRRLAWISGAALSFFFFWLALSTMELAYFIIMLLFIVATVLAYKFLYRDVKAHRSLFFAKRQEVETRLQQKGYSFAILQMDLLAWFFFDPKRRAFGFYFNDKEQFVCPIQNLIRFETGARNSTYEYLFIYFDERGNDHRYQFSLSVLPRIYFVELFDKDMYGVFTDALNASTVNAIREIRHKLEIEMVKPLVKG